MSAFNFSKTFESVVPKTYAKYIAKIARSTTCDV